ncbi:hypothetical protein K440DRAFT_683004 [Wilcoxina mikolae CBS 423.85]|nr:hypothetical protein K440DRAFT_683004 [Wilcoxina mikolae CBS 423.85]
MRTTSTLSIAPLTTSIYSIAVTGLDFGPSSTVHSSAAATSYPPQITSQLPPSTKNEQIRTCSWMAYAASQYITPKASPWLGCDQIRPQCCVPGYRHTHLPSAQQLPLAQHKTFASQRVPMVSNLELYHCSRPELKANLTPLESYSDDWKDRGALCARTMNSEELSIESKKIWTAVIGAQDLSSNFTAAPQRFQSRFVVVGYFMDSTGIDASSYISRDRRVYREFKFKGHQKWTIWCSCWRYRGWCCCGGMFDWCFGGLYFDDAKKTAGSE